MAVHNGAPYLRTAIDSILQQTYRDFHFLIVDDGSTDETRSIIRSYEDKRIELLSLDQNVGQTAALNIGLRTATTQWIARMDADDYSAPNRLEEQLRALDADTSLNCVGAFAWRFRDDPSVVEGIQTKPLYHTEINRVLLQGSPIIHGSIVVSTKALLDVGGYNERYRYSADLELYDRLLAKYVAANIPKPLIGVRLHPNQGSCSRIAVEEVIDILSRRLATNHYCSENAAMIRESLSITHFLRVRHLRVEGKYFELLKGLLLAFQTSPRTFVWHVFTFLILCRIPKEIRTALKRLLMRTIDSSHSFDVVEQTTQQVEPEHETQTMLSSFKRVADALYTARRNCPTLPVLGILWMHPKYPVDPVQEELMRGDGVREGTEVGEGGIKGWVVWQAGRYLVHTARLIRALARMRWSLRREIRALKGQRFDVVVKTWCFGAERSAENRDFYYGDMQRRLADRGVRMLLLCGDASGADREVFARAQVSTSGLCLLPELCLVHPLAPVWMAVKQVGSSLRLWLMKARERDVLLRRVYGLASRDCLSLSAALAGLFFWIGRAVVKTWHPRAFVTLYEGHGWEKCAWWGAKTGDPSCKTVGYQHTVVHDHTVSLLKPQNHGCEYSTPDVVLCLGEKTKQMIEPGHRPRKSKLITFGSFRFHSSNGRKVYEAPKPGRRTVLVLPAGIPGEAKLIFDWAVAAAVLLPDHRFIFRCHPVLPFDKIRRELKVDPEHLPNIEISNHEAIADDFSRSSAVLYRGSSSILYAVLHGLKLIYLRDENQLDVDPLFELANWRESVSSVKELADMLRRYAATRDDSATEEWRSAAEYVNSYVMPVDDASVERFLKTLGLIKG